jgi:hypothetical protein
MRALFGARLDAVGRRPVAREMAIVDVAQLALARRA